MSTTSQTLRKPCRRNKPKSASASKPPVKSLASPKPTLQKRGASALVHSSNGSKASESRKASTSKKSSQSSGNPGSSKVQESIARVVKAIRSDGAAPGEDWELCTGILERYAKDLSRVQSHEIPSFSVSPSEIVRQNLAAISYISSKSVEFLICDYLRGIDDRIEYPASLYEDSLSFCTTKKEERATISRFRKYRDTHGLDFPDEIIKINRDKDAGKITEQEAAERRRAFRDKVRQEKEGAR